jgi:hypothetical protein
MYGIDDLLNIAVSAFDLFGGGHVVSASPRANVVRSERQSLLVREEHSKIMATYGIVIQEETM